MPRGDNPNSRKALEKNRKKTQFSGENAVKMGAKGNATRKYNASFRAAGRDMLTDTAMQKMWSAMIKRAEQGNINAFKMLFDVMGEATLDLITQDAEVNLAFIETVSTPEPPPEDIEDEVDEDE